jgi:DNA-binding response OmpR family regulator
VSRTPDLILLDLNLSRREGFDILRAVPTRPALVASRWAFILTSSDANRDRHRVSLIGAERYIHTPLTLEEFIDETDQAIEDMLPR